MSNVINIGNGTGMEFLGDYSFNFAANARALTSQVMMEDADSYKMLIFTIADYSVVPQITKVSDKLRQIKFSNVDTSLFGDVSIVPSQNASGFSGKFNVCRTVYASAAALNVQVWGIK